MHRIVDPVAEAISFTQKLNQTGLHLKFREHPLEASFLKRQNRFSVLVRLKGQAVAAHLPNSGRLGELLVPGRRCYILPALNPLRKTHYDLVLIETPNGLLTSTDARLPNQLFAKAFESTLLPEFENYSHLEREVAYQQSRLDFRLSNSGQICYVEVKSVTLVNDGIALFPDAPTTRGTRHLSHLMALKQSGFDAAIVFWVQRGDAVKVRPNCESDPVFAKTLADAQQKGVQILAYKSDVRVDGFEFMGSIPVKVTC